VATIKITDQLGLSVDAQLAPASSLVKYAAALPGLILSGADISQLEPMRLDDPALRSLQPALSFSEPVSIGSGGSLTLAASAGASFKILNSGVLFSPDEYGDNIAIPAGTCYVALGFSLQAKPGIDVASGDLPFGLAAASGIAIDSYHPFPLGPAAPGIIDALRQSIGDFVIPRSTSDLDAMIPGAVVTIKGTGSLTFSGSANLLALTNPLASVPLPSPLPTPAVNESASVTIGASWRISGEYQVRAQKIDSRRVRLGWYRKRASEFTVSASASAGLAAAIGSNDLWPTIIGAISPGAAAGKDPLVKARVPASQSDAIEDAIKSAVDRKLQLAITAELVALTSDDAAFLYELDLATLDDAGLTAVDRALRGDLSGIANPNTLPCGITELRSIWTKAAKSHLSFRINLLGIFNYASVADLALKGVVTFTPSTGELVIMDQTSASRVNISAVNFGPDEEKLRQLMAESFLITAAYRGSRIAAGAPTLSSSHVFFKIDQNTSRTDMRKYAAIASALGRGVPAVPSADNFGRTALCAEASYNDALSRALFLGPDGAPRGHAEYENAGRRAIALLVLPDGDDAFRLGPATNDDLWNRMKDLGPANFSQLMPEAQANGVRPDYLAIQWWADAMCGAGAILARMNRLFAGSAAVDPNDRAFHDLREELAKHLRNVAAKAREQFGSPWGLVAMFLVSGMSAKTAIDIVAPHFVYSAGQTLTAAG
jgi:hypothetical protein